MTGLPPVITVAVGTSFICALTKTGTILCWGIGGDGQLGDGAMTNRATPAPIADNHVFANVLASNYTGCGLTGDGEAYCWGDNYYNERGDESYVVGGAKPPLAQPTPFHAAASHQFASLMVGYMQACGLQSNGQAICWGRGDYGRLGTGIGLGPTPPLPVQIPEPLQSVASPFETGCAIGISGQLYCYGSDERTLPGTTPLERGIMIPSPFIPWSEAWYVPPLPSMLGIRLKSILGGGFFHMCAISADGAIYCFGHPVGT
jgi:alpha-tubulin suppressor-like RCC1 family protein